MSGASRCPTDMQALSVQGVGRLTLAFQQLAVAAMSISAIHTLQAAAVHPPITRLAAGLFFLVGGARPLSDQM